MEIDKENNLKIQKPNFGDFKIPINNLKTKAPGNAPMQNNVIGNKILESIGGGVGAINSNLSSILGLTNSFNAPSGNQKRMSIADSSIDTLANATSSFGPIGSAIGAGLKLINNIGGSFVKDTSAIKNFGINENISNGYGGVNSEAQDISSDINSYKKSGLIGKLFGRSKISREADINTGKQFAASKITNDQTKLKDAASNSIDMLSSNINKKFKKDNSGLAILSKKGNSIPRFNKGGSIILSGSLHARKHNLNKEKGLLKDIEITNKGVPVILINKNGGEMFAEFEKEEIVFRKELIDEISKLREEYKKEDKEEKRNNILFNIGRILTKEILSKTKDKDGLIDDID